MTSQVSFISARVEGKRKVRDIGRPVGSMQVSPFSSLTRACPPIQLAWRPPLTKDQRPVNRKWFPCRIALPVPGPHASTPFLSSAQISFATCFGRNAAAMAHPLAWHRHHAVLASIVAIASIILQKLAGGSSNPP